MKILENKLLAIRKNKFCVYLDSIFINDAWKKQLTDQKLLGTQTQVYIYYPELFWVVFNGYGYEPEILDKLCIAAYLYFISIILQDKLLDEDNNKNIQSLPLISFLQEETIKILLEIFPKQHKFWENWHYIREKYIESINFDKKTNTPLAFSDYESFAINKSIYALAAIDCCYFVSDHQINNKIIYKKLIKSHKLFSVAFQILDDFYDLAEDFENKQVNIIIQNCFEEAIKSNIILDTIDKLKKFFYLSGYARDILNKCETYFNNAVQEIESIPNMEMWKSLIDSQRLKVLRMLTNINIYSKEVYAKTYFSNKKIQNVISLDDRIKKIEYFIIKQQNSNGSWSDMVTNQGISEVWTTGFITWNLSQNNTNRNSYVDLAIEYLFENRSLNLWGYNPNMIWDIDSSFNVLFAIDQNNAIKKRDIDLLIGSQKPNGAFCTYVDDKDLKKYLGHKFQDFSGWTHEHICVSALALYFLCVSKKNNNAKNKLLNYLLPKQNNDGLWESYWWTSPLYSTAFIVKSLIIENYEKYNRIITSAINSILQLRNSNYSFGDSHDNESAFFTLLVLDMLCSSNITFNKYKEYVSLIMNWVLNNQLEDGSFHSSYILRIPSPEIKNPNKIKMWVTNNSKGVNVVKSDFMRLFTTSLAFQALNKYNKYNK